MFKFLISVSLFLALSTVGCTRDRVAEIDFNVDLDPADASAMATRSAEAIQDGQAPETIEPPFTYIVKDGDNLALIAAEHFVSIEIIRNLNPQLLSDRLVPGDEILIPVVEPPVKLAPAEVSDNAGVYFYEVKDGDTVSEIADEFGITIQDIKTANPGVILDLIAVGQRLALPRGVEPPPEPTVNPNVLYHEVRKGETLGDIAVLYNVEALEIARINRLNSPDQLGIGQKLQLPDSAILSMLPVEESSETEGLIHIVKEGETLSEIALHYEVRLSTLVEVNNLSDADQLALGQELFVPGVVQRTSEGLRIHTVRVGETLSSIAELYQIPVTFLQTANNLADGDKLAEGQELVIPEVPG